VALSSLTGDVPPASLLRGRGDLPPVLEVVVPVGSVGDELAQGMDSILHAFGDRFRLIVVDVRAAPGHGVDFAARACEYVIQVTGSLTPPPESRARVFQVVNRYRGSAGRSPLNSCEPFVLPVEPALTDGWAPDRPLPITDPTLPISRVLRRLTRKIAGVTVGIALGGGAAFGIAHVGVLQALDHAGLPVDLVAGTSMGSIVALGYAVGMTPPEMYEVAGRIGNVRTALSALDPSLSGAGLLNGRRLVSIFSPILQRESFEDLDVPCRVVALDIEAGTPVSIGSGSLDEAFRTSCSIPIIFKPVRRGSQTLVDGGMIDPVPGGVVREMGADIVIAVNVVPRLEPGVSTSLSRTFKRVNYLNPISYLSGSRDLPDILDIFMNSMQVLQHELGNFKSFNADVLVNVDLGGFTWIDFHRALDIVEQGRLAGERAVPEIRAALEARVGSTDR
jgi:NTE family protein